MMQKLKLLKKESEMKQPEPIQLDIPTMNNSVMYSMMPINDLMKLRTFLDDLIKWKAAGNPVYIMTLEYEVKEA